MNISKLALIALLGGALTAFGCTDDEGGGGTGGGAGGSGGIDPVCQPVTQTCESGMSAAIDECELCDLATPPTADVCDGTESLDNPASCAAIGNPVTHILTFMQLDEECNDGTDLDGCNGNSCKNGGLNPTPEGTDGVDNGLASIGATVVELADVDLSGVQQAFYDSLCGLTDDPTSGTCLKGDDDGMPCPGRVCVGGDAAGKLCTTDMECPMGTCNTDDGCADGTERFCDSGTNKGEPCTTTDDCPLSGSGDGCVTAGTCVLDDSDCGEEITPLTLKFVVDANVAANCANVTVISEGVCADEATACTSDDACAGIGDGTCAGGGTSEVILNLSDPVDGGGSGGSGGNGGNGGNGGSGGDVSVCASGTLGTIPAVVTDVAGTFGNAVVRMTVSPDGFSNGTLSATADAATATAIATAISPVAANLVDGTFDINSDLSGDTSAACNAVSLTLDIGGVVEP